MANVARDNLDVIRISRKLILSELVKKLGGTEPEYDCWFEDGRFWSTVRTRIAVSEANTSRKMEQATGSLESSKESAEEGAAIALIELLKRIYKFEVDDMNFMKRAKAEYENEQLLKQVDLSASVQNWQAQRIQILSKCTRQLVIDMDFVQETCHDICGTALATAPANQKSGALTDMIYSVNYLDDWTDQRIYEHIANLK